MLSKLKSLCPLITYNSRRGFHASQPLKTQMTVREALNSALAEELERDPKVFVMGEEVGHYGGAYRVTKDLYAKFGPKRIWDTPITEAGFTGLGCGAAMWGMRPVIEYMNFNFAMQGIDHIINTASKIRYMSGGELDCPIVFRGPNGAASSLGAQHSQCFAAWYSQVPGLYVLAPYDVEDSRGLLKAAIRDPNPIVFLESELMYGHSFEASREVLDKDYVLPIGKAKIQRSGKDITIVSFSKMVGKCLEAADILASEGIEAEVINLRSLRPLDRKTIVESAMKTKRIITVEEGFPQCGIGAEICALMWESLAYRYLDAPVERVTGLEVPMPYAPKLEAMSLPQPQNIVNVAKKVLHEAQVTVHILNNYKISTTRFVQA